jgi:hypothetical protein
MRRRSETLGLTSGHSEQVRFLYRQLPAEDATDKRLNERQFSAIFLLGLSGAPWVAPALVDRLDFTSEAYLHPVMWAIVPLGELAVEPLVQSLQNDNPLQINMACLALREIKGDKEPLPFDDDWIRIGGMNDLPIEEKLPEFVDQVLKRKDLKLSASTVLSLKLTFLNGSGDEG